MFGMAGDSLSPNRFDFLLTLSCPDSVGIVHRVAGFLVERNANVLDSAQYGDPSTGYFFMRVHFDLEGKSAEELLPELETGFAPVGDAFRMEWKLVDARHRPRILILGSKAGHCVNDLLFRWRSGQLRAEVVGVVSNHPVLEPLAQAAGVPFWHLPTNPAIKPEQEGQILSLIERHRVELVVLARYMQVLSEPFCDRVQGRAINIHHSFLPSFRGAQPYRQAYEHGVKLIGATAHYVTPDLDEGPIIEQDVERVDHSMLPEDLAAIGRDIESRVLARAVRYHIERRVLLNGAKTVVFR